MFLERQATDAKRALEDWETKDRENTKAAAQIDDRDKPLTCMIFFFASQMQRHLRNTESIREDTSPSTQHPEHRLDTLLSKVGTHAAFSPHITRFETFPVEIPPVRRSSRWQGKEPSRESMHDTMLLIKFRSKHAREEWIATSEWMEFMAKTEEEGVFRRMPHVRCAGSLKGLRDPMEILRA